MKRVRSHYDNLKVSRDAPDSVIRAAYKTLSQQYHPDLAKEPNGERVMAIINASYAVRSDPEKRRQHDAWLAVQEQQEQVWRSFTVHESTTPPPPPRPAKRSANGVSWLILFIIGIVYFSIEDSGKRPSSSSPSSTIATAPAHLEPVAPPYLKPLVAPNGQPWPAQAGYLHQTAVGRHGGLSELTIDNSRNDHDVYAKLIHYTVNGETAARHVFLPRRSRFTLKDIAQGSYGMRYKILDSGEAYKANDFSLTEVDTGDSIQYSTITMTLYSVANGNMRPKRIPADSF